jgi:hypothetical protein
MISIKIDFLGQGALCSARGHNYYQCTADSESAEDYFFLRAKHIMGHFEGFFDL